MFLVVTMHECASRPLNCWVPCRQVLVDADIRKVLPHRYPFLLVDKILEYVPGERAVGVKCITANEPQFTGHFPDRPIMPGVLQVKAAAPPSCHHHRTAAAIFDKGLTIERLLAQVEAMAQLGGIVALQVCCARVPHKPEYQRDGTDRGREGENGARGWSGKTGAVS